MSSDGGSFITWNSERDSHMAASSSMSGSNRLSAIYDPVWMEVSTGRALET